MFLPIVLVFDLIFVSVVDESRGLRLVVMSTESLVVYRSKNKILNHLNYKEQSTFNECSNS